MKTLMLSALATVTLTLSACGDAAPAVLEEPAALTTRATPDTLPGRRFELRLRGENAAGYDAVLVPIRSVEVTAAGTRLPVSLEAGTVDLAAREHAHLLGTFFVPEGVEEVQVTLTFDSFGGWEQGARAGSLDARGAPLRFEAPVASLSQRGRAVVELDVEGSLVPVGQAQRLLLPHLTVRY
jgi:hypothetical protein